MAKRYRQLYDAATAGNGTLTFTPTTGMYMRVVMGHMKVTTDATVANRYVRMDALDSAGVVIGSSHAGAPVTASLTNRELSFMPGVYRETAFIDVELQVPFAKEFLIPMGGSLRFTVTNGVAGDTFSANFLVEEF